MKMRRATLRKAELTAALTCAFEAGLTVRSTRVFPDGGFALDFGEVEQPSSSSDLDLELMRLEARYGEG